MQVSYSSHSHRIVHPYEPIYWSPKLTLKLRFAFLFSMLAFEVYQYEDIGLVRYYYLTVQAEVLMIIYTVIAILHHMLYKDEGKFITKLKGIIMHLTLSMQFLVMIFYWIFVAEADWIRIQRMYPTRGRRIAEFAIGFWQHALYCAFVWFNLITERSTLSKSNFKYVLAYAAFYSALNYYATLLFGKPLYPVIDWKTPMTLVFLSIAFSLSFIGFYLALKLSQASNLLFKFGYQDHPGDGYQPTGGKKRSSN